MTPPAGGDDTPLTPDRWRQVKGVMYVALDLPEAERGAFLEAACGGDAALRGEVESLLVAAAGSGVVDRPPAALGSASGDAFGGSFGGPFATGVGDASGRGADPDGGAAALFDRVAAGVGAGYALEREVGRGGMAVVYRARDLRHRRPVALKVLRPDVSVLLGRARFEDEVLLAAGLQHAHIVPVLGSGEADGMLWFAMPYVDGGSLRGRLEKERQLPVAEAVRLAREVARALDYAHRHGTVHRDVKPENVLLSDGHALVTDFGIAKALQPAADEDSRPALTRPGFVLGTPGYMAPEQATGARTLDARADVFALGIVLYEMLAGARPFVGAMPTDESRVRGGPPPLAGVRDDVPAWVEAAARRALAYDPAERFPSAAAFEAALATGETGANVPAVAPADATGGSTSRRFPRVRRRPAVVALGVAAAAGIAGVLLVRRTPALDANRVMVFPLAVAAGAAPEGTGADVATLVGYALEGTAPLRWIEASDYLRASPNGTTPPSPAERRSLSETHGAAYYVDGNVVRRGDSATVVLRLHSVDGDSVVALRGASGRVGEAAVADLGLRAVGELLVPLLAPGRRVDVSALQDRAPGAVAEFLQGEREYRASRFESALARYRAALERDTAFALAALQGAQAASWIESDSAATPLARVAVAHVASLPPYRAAIARGYIAYLTGAADPAITEFRQAIGLDSSHAEPWMALGDVYRHLLPRATNLDSLAEFAFVRARRADPTFIPPLYHLSEMAIRRGALARADTLVREYNRANPEGTTRRTLDLALQCATNASPPAWDAAARVDQNAVLQAGVLLADRPAYARCSRAALEAALLVPDANIGWRWTVTLALQSLLVALGRDREVVQLLTSATAREVAADRLLVLDALAGARVDEQAAEVVRRLGDNFGVLSVPRLWLLGTWHGERGEAVAVRAIARRLALRADSTHARGDSLVARAIAARVALAEGDTVEAIRRLRALTPSAPLSALDNDPWECLGGERLLLARLLLARGEYREARAAAELVDAPHPITMLLYRRAALLLRARAADAGGDDDPAARTQLAALAHAT